MKNSALAAALLCASGVHAAGVNVLMHHNDTSHTGANLAETQLTTANVNSAQFGKLWDYEVDSEVYAQPLIIQGITIPGLGTHDLLIVATMNNTVYAFDADNNLGANVAPLWQTNFNDPAAGIVPPRTANVFGSVTNIDPLTPIGIVSTPVIDPATDTLYVVSRTVQNGTYGYQLHALDLTTGADRTGSPVSITASVPGTGYDAVNGVVTFNAQQQLQRDALGLANNQVVIAWGSQGDINPYHGWIMTYDETSLQQTGVFNTTPTGSEGGIWQSGDGPSIDANGYVYYAVGNGTFDGISNFGQSVVKFSVASSGISVQSFFAPSDYVSLNQGDLDLGVSGPLLIPGTSMLLNGSKTGDLYLLNTGSLGGEVPGNTQIPQTFTAAAGHIHGSPVYFPYSTSGPLIYVWSESDTLKAFPFNGSKLGTTPVTTSSFSAPPGMPGGVMSISSNGSQSGTGVVWASIPLNADAENAVVSGVLRAFDASNLSSELYDTQQNATRDSIGLYAKYSPPTVANGRVYMSTFSNKVRVYGLLGSQTAAPKGTLSGTSSTTTATVNLTAAGASDWAHWPGYVHKATGNAQISDLESLYPPYAMTTYTNDQRTFTWSDGTPTASGSVTSGVYVSGWAGGYQISAPADTNPRTLTVYVGGYNSAGHLRAFLSDGSAEDFIATTSTSSGNYYIAYTLTYTAGQSGQLLYVQWTQASSSGNVSFAGATLTGGSVATTPPPTPTGITASQGTSSTGVTVSWSPATGATGYTIYRSGVSGTLGTVLTTTAGTSFTDTTAVPGTTYYYSIAATNSDGSSTVSAQVSGYVEVSTTGGALSGVGLGTLSTANLTTVGSSDWAHWPEFTEKATGGGQISNFTLVGSGSLKTYNNA
ncbi:MAG TPA: fibronectin type III domain-containing protein, partial [Steroidobacteraceae bacterium]|nr:fibronectin type III domain-containing protein [Steroidobacteraceae bacterium]